MIEDSDKNIGKITSVFGKTGIIETTDGERQNFIVKSQKLRPVVGDNALFISQDDGTIVVTMILEANNQLERLNQNGQQQVVASNISQILVITAPLPQPNFLLIDKFLLVSELMDCNLSIIFNKVDLVERNENRLEIYQKLDYPVVMISAKEKINLNPLFNLLNEQTTVLVGQSGVGKSTIINLLISKDKIKTEALSNKNQKGKHTTSTSTMHALEGNGYLIDTPGVENLNPNINDIKEIETGFKEIASLANGCKYRDCIHINEPNCAVNHGLINNEVASLRYRNYKKLVQEFQ
jgi:ribosome biogenesis GTPase|tara:strand:+ start:43 stop:924 length:882 start_codon:yes stop_codon:yes gene_type:complete